MGHDQIREIKSSRNKKISRIFEFAKISPRENLSQ